MQFFAKISNPRVCLAVFSPTFGVLPLMSSFSGESIGINVDNGELIDASEAQIYDHILIKV